MKLLLCLAGLALSGVPAAAAVSIFVEPDSSGNAVFTVTQTAPNPVLNVSGAVGFVLGMEIPTSMWNIPDQQASSSIEGTVATLGSITETFSQAGRLLNRLRISADASPSLLLFDTVLEIGPGASAVQFQLKSAGPVPTSISFAALTPGTHSVPSLNFGSVVVTVVPEAASAALVGTAALALVSRRRRPVRH